MNTPHLQSLHDLAPRLSVKGRIASCLLAAMMACMWVAAPAPAQSKSSSREYQIKAAMLYHFAQFTEWPDDAFKGQDVFIIGVLGEDPFGTTLDEVLHGKTVKGRPVVTRRFEQAEEARGAHILFISSSELQRLPEIIEVLQHSNVLTVGEEKPFTRRNGIIRLFLVKNKTNFEINLEAATRAGIKLSSKLLKLAVII